jgi:two-component system sensor histidine kinase TctE
VNSIRLRLLAWLFGPILLFNFAAAALTYVLAWTPAQLAFDQGLLDSATALARQVAGGAPLSTLAAPGEPDDPDTTWFAVRRATDGALMAGVAAVPAGAGPGVHDARIGADPVRFASRGLMVSGKPMMVTVAKTIRQRQQVKRAIARALVLLEMAFTFGLAGLAWFSIGNGLAPLARLRSALNRRERAELSPLDPAATPTELAPVVGAFNSLLERLDASASAQDAFLADVAHQLRTPLAGAKLQLEWLAGRHAGDAASQHALALMTQANERMIRQTNQLLALARAEPGRAVKVRFAALDLADVVAESVQVFVDQAAARRIDLGFELAPAQVMGERFMLRDLVDNLVDNALRYTPAGGSVTVRTRHHVGATTLEVEDSGPGIPVTQRASVFQRHVRLDQQTSGSGLGLSIVRDIAQVHGASATVNDASAHGGALFAVTFPV